MKLRQSMMLRIALGVLAASTFFSDPSMAAAAPAAPGSEMPAASEAAPIAAAGMAATELLPSAPVTNQIVPRRRPVFIRVFICIRQVRFIPRRIRGRLVFIRIVTFRCFPVFIRRGGGFNDIEGLRLRAGVR